MILQQINLYLFLKYYLEDNMEIGLINNDGDALEGGSRQERSCGGYARGRGGQDLGRGGHDRGRGGQNRSERGGLHTVAQIHSSFIDGTTTILYVTSLLIYINVKRSRGRHRKCR